MCCFPVSVTVKMADIEEGSIIPSRDHAGLWLWPRKCYLVWAMTHVASLTLSGHAHVLVWFTCRAGNQMWGSSLDEYLAIDTSEHMGQLARALRNGAVLEVDVACPLS